MASQERAAPADIVWTALAGRINDRLGIDFHQLVELVRHLVQQDPGQHLKFSPGESAIYHTAPAGMGFNVPGLCQVSTDKLGRICITTSTLALQGSDSPLPGHYLDALALEESQSQQDERYLGNFIGLFNQRLIEMVHDIWCRNRYYMVFRNGGTDAFSQTLFALVGLGNREVRHHFPVAHSKMLAYAGILSSPGRSPEVVCGLVMHCFDLASVHIDMWQFRWVTLRQEQYTRPGVERHMGGNEYEELSVLGGNFILGSRLMDAGGKFALTLSQLTWEQFLDFLPGGEHHAALVTFISFILGDQLAWQLNLRLAEGEMKQGQPGDEETCRLGYTFFIGEPVGEPEQQITIRN